MKKITKLMSLIVVSTLSLSIFLTGCNSKAATKPTDSAKATQAPKQNEVKKEESYL